MMPLEVTWDKDLNAWTKPYFMGPMNAKVVRRSNAVMGYPYGQDFRYQETGLTRGGLGGYLSALTSTLIGRLFLIAMATPRTRALLEQHVLPKSGEGPDEETRRAGSYAMVLVGETAEGAVLKARVTGEGDPGVRSTTLMLTQAALCLAQDADRLPVGGGFWTPASAMGPLLRERIIAHAGMTFTLLEDF